MKKGRKQNCFEGKLSDGNSKLRFVGFDTKQQRKMSDMPTKKEQLKLKIVRLNLQGEGTRWRFY